METIRKLIQVEKRKTFETTCSEEHVLLKLEGFVGVFSHAKTTRVVTGEQELNKPE